MAKFFKCTYQQLMQYVEDNKLKRFNDGMHIIYKDENGEEKATIMHGFAFDEYSIKDEPNYETLLFMNKFLK